VVECLGSALGDLSWTRVAWHPASYASALTAPERGATARR
jgi:hypothetical protein